MMREMNLNWSIAFENFHYKKERERNETKEGEEFLLIICIYVILFI